MGDWVLKMRSHEIKPPPPYAAAGAVGREYQQSIFCFPFHMFTTPHSMIMRGEFMIKGREEKPKWLKMERNKGGCLTSSLGVGAWGCLAEKPARHCHSDTILRGNLYGASKVSEPPFIRACYTPIEIKPWIFSGKAPWSLLFGSLLYSLHNKTMISAWETCSFAMLWVLIPNVNNNIITCNDYCIND